MFCFVFVGKAQNSRGSQRYSAGQIYDVHYLQRSSCERQDVSERQATPSRAPLSESVKKEGGRILNVRSCVRISLMGHNMATTEDRVPTYSKKSFSILFQYHFNAKLKNVCSITSLCY